MRYTLLIIALFITLPGCGSSIKEYPTANVTGKVTCNGEPVKNARVYFSPIAKSGGTEAGKSGWGSTGEDGTFTISTYGTDDGRVPATYEMIFLHGWAPDASQPRPLRPGSAAARLADALGTTETRLSD